jgi:serine protease Do
MNDRPGKILLVESEAALRESLVLLLTGTGYDVSTDYSGGMKTLLSFGPDLVIMGADPPQLRCCDLLSEIKGSKHTSSIRVLMLAPGSSAERTRGLDLGADDVLSLPVDPDELLSRVRYQLRSKESGDELLGRLHLAEESRTFYRRVVNAVNEERRTLIASGIGLLAVVVIAFVASTYFYRRSQAQNVRVYAAITKLQSGMLGQQLIESYRNADQALATQPPKPGGSAGDHNPQKASDSAKSAPTLEAQVATVESRVEQLEKENRVAEDIIQADEPSVCLIHVVLSFRDRATGTNLHYASITASGDPETDKSGNPLVSLDGSGPEVHLDVFGTGFLVTDDGQILTNHHVAEPWWQNDDIKEMLDQGLEPEVIEMSAYFPGLTRGLPISTRKISSNADVAVVQANLSGLGIRHIELADEKHSVVSGSPVVLLGYPTGVQAILARTGSATLHAIATSSKGDPQEVMEELARRRLISPVVTQGHIGDVLPDRIVYDAQTTSGGSGGPLFNNQGQVIGINFAMVTGFGGSNFAIPIRYAKALLRQ